MYIGNKHERHVVRVDAMGSHANTSISKWTQQMMTTKITASNWPNDGVMDRMSTQENPKMTAL